MDSSKVVCSPSMVQAHPGQDVVLSCQVEPPFDLTRETLEWKHGKEDVHRYPSLWDYLDHQDSRFFNRTSLITEYLKDGIASLTLTNFTNQDEGNYSFCLPELLSCSDVTLTENSSEVVCSPSMVQAHPGQDVVLSCQVEPPFDLTRETLEWKHGTTGFMHVYRSGRDNYDEQDKSFFNRTILNRQNLKDGNVSLTLTNFTMKDEGNYTFCLRTQTPFMCSDVTLTKILQMDNETHNHLGSSKVVCFPHLDKIYRGQDVVLSCRVKPPFDLTNETLEWKHGKEDVHRYPSLWDYLDHQYSRFFNRTFLNHPNLKDGIASLTLTNFTNQDEGNYSFCLPELLSCTDVTLTERSDLSFGDYSAIVGGVFGVFGVLGVLGAVVVGGILAFLRSRRTDHQPNSASIPLRSPEDPAEI